MRQLEPSYVSARQVQQNKMGLFGLREFVYVFIVIRYYCGICLQGERSADYSQHSRIVYRNENPCLFSRLRTIALESMHVLRRVLSLLFDQVLSRQDRKGDGHAARMVFMHHTHPAAVGFHDTLAQSQGQAFSFRGLPYFLYL